MQTINYKKLVRKLIVAPGKKVSLRRDFDPSYDPLKVSKEDAAEMLRTGIERLSEYQDKLYAQDTYGVLIILQAMDAAGKDGTIKHVMSGLNPQGVQVYSFKAPSQEEMDHDYLWRCFKALPERGRIGLFNRSYYEEVLVVRVHPEILARQKLPAESKDKNIWNRRFEEINNFEKYLVSNGIVVLKFFLNVSKEEQKNRFMARIEEPEKNWKFSAADIKERKFWDDYQRAYESCLANTSTDWAPWYVIPADSKPFARLAITQVIYHRLKELKLHYPVVSEDAKKELLQAKGLLEAEE
jgi:PPK2 family polyphosphate:nucleotide phosphotransferase